MTQTQAQYEYGKRRTLARRLLAAGQASAAFRVRTNPDLTRGLFIQEKNK